MTCRRSIHQQSPKQGTELVGSSASLSQAHSRQGKAIIPSDTSHFSYCLSSACSHPGKLLPDLQFILNTMLMNLSGLSYNPNKGLSPHKILLCSDTLEQVAALLSFPFSFKHEENRCSQITQFKDHCLANRF